MADTLDPDEPVSTDAQPVVINNIQVVQGLDEEGDMAVWFDHNPEMDIVTAIGLCEMAKAYFLGLHAAHAQAREDGD